jgi:hypothetical protein
MLDPAFVADCPYGPGGLLIDDIVSIDRERSRIVARMPTGDDLPITRDQRAHPVRHPRHVSGGLIVHVTGIVGFAHGYHILDLRHADGWIGYGTHIHSARFKRMAGIGAPLELECTATSVRRIRGNYFITYRFDFRQEAELIYEAEQSAVWTRVVDEQRQSA